MSSSYPCPGSGTTVAHVCRYMPFSLILYLLLLSKRSARISSDSLESKFVLRVNDTTPHETWRVFPRGFNHFVIHDIGEQISAEDREGDFSALETYFRF